MTTKYQPNAANQYASIAHGTEVVEPEYDPQGNLLHDATRKYTWDADIHLMSVTTEGHREPQRSEESGATGAADRGAAGSVASGQASGLPHIAPHNAVDEAPSKTTTTRFVYDALHRRLGRVKDNGETTVFVYEGWNVIAEKTTPKADTRDTENSKLETRHLWGEDLSGSLQGAGGIGGLLRTSVTKTGSNGTRKTEHEHTFSYDSNGNVILLTDTQGRESARYAYDAFGKTLTATGPAARGNRYRFSTKPVEEGSGLVYYGYRYYDPVTGRWPSRDPIGEMGGVNVYGMVGNNLHAKIDVLGLATHGLCGVTFNCTYSGETSVDCFYHCNITAVNDVYDSAGGFCALIGAAVGDFGNIVKPKSDCPSAGCRATGYQYTQSINGLYYDHFMSDPITNGPLFDP